MLKAHLLALPGIGAVNALKAHGRAEASSLQLVYPLEGPVWTFPAMLTVVSLW
jgi:hypothetical protein